MQKKFNLALLIIGFSGMVAQIILLRELLIIYHGNELSLGLIIANWLISEAAGVYLMSIVTKKISRKLDFFVFLQITFSLVFPLSIISVRILKNMIHITPGEILSPSVIFLSSLALIFFPALIHGSLFTLSCKLREKKDEPAASIGYVYVFETMGNIISALCLAYFLIPRFHSLDIAFIVSLLIAFSCTFLVYPEKLFLHLKKSRGMISFLILIGFLFVLLSGISDKLHTFSIKSQWKGQKVLSYKNSIFGNITATQMEEQITFYINANPIFICPTPDIEGHEELVHIPLLFHPKPQNILVVSGGLGGLLQELLKYPEIHVDYTEIDPAIIQTAVEIDNDLPIEPIHTELNSNRIQNHLVDGRLFVMNTKKTYDAIFINLDLPSELQTNRLYTKEFFQKASLRLKKDGLLILTLPGSLNYLTSEMKKLNASIRSTIKSTFSSLLVIPGETNIYIASHTDLQKNINALSNTLKKRNINTKVLTPFHLSLKLDSTYQQWFESEMKDTVSKVNEDLNPTGVLYAQAYLASFFAPETKNLFSKISHISYKSIMLPLIILTILLFPLRFFSRKIFTKTVLSYAILTTGFSSMFFNLATILLFQIFYGYVYHWISLLIAFFMAGISVGGYLGLKIMQKIKAPKSKIIHIEIYMALLILLLPILSIIYTKTGFSSLYYNLFRYALLFLNFFLGLLQGYEFTLVSKSYNVYASGIEKTAGSLYACDLVGGFIGGVLSTIILVPLYGLMKACLIAVMLKAMSSFMLLFTKGEKNHKT